MFALQNTSPIGRRGTLTTSHGTIETPFFMPVGTAGAMKGITHTQLEELGAQIMLCNTYHLALRPGIEVIKKAGGLHEFIGWQKPILTDSGGFQVFSLKNIRKITDDGVLFRSHIDGDELFLGPKEAIEIQHALGADIIMCFDECPPSTASRREIEAAVDRTLRWAQACKETLSSPLTAHRSPLLFAVIQGGLHMDLRKKCAEELIAIGFDGYAIGGLAVGESPDEMFDVVREVTPHLPKDKPRYLMGVGEIEQMKKCIALGIDMFDCVLPVRLARHGKIFLNNGTEIAINNASFKNDTTPIDADSPSPLSRKHSKSYLHHLLRINERYGETIAVMQNLGVTLEVMRELRGQIN